MCPGQGYQVPVDEEAEAEDLVAAAEEAEEAEAAAAAAAEARVLMRRAVALLFADAHGLSDLIARTQHSRAMLASAIDRLHEAALELNLPISGAGRIMPVPLEGAGGPVPGSIDAARRIAGRLCGMLPPARYLQIYECWYPLKYMAKVYIEAEDLLARCADILLLPDESTQWQRWGRRMDAASDQPGVVRRRLMDAQGRARIAYSGLFNLVEFWHADGVARMDRPVTLSSAEEDLHVAMDLMDQALTAMRLMYDALYFQAYELMILARNNEGED